MLRQYARFFVNGALLGVVAWYLQLALFRALGGDSPAHYALASVVTYVPLVLINFELQRRLIFGRPGRFARFVAANLAVMVVVSLAAPLCQLAIATIAGEAWGERLGFAAAAVLGSLPSFLLKRRWVFGVGHVTLTRG